MGLQSTMQKSESLKSENLMTRIQTTSKKLGWASSKLPELDSPTSSPKTYTTLIKPARCNLSDNSDKKCSLIKSLICKKTKVLFRKPKQKSFQTSSEKSLNFKKGSNHPEMRREN
jgi:hypothetical protein